MGCGNERNVPAMRTVVSRKDVEPPRVRPVALALGDVHLRSDRPECRTDEWWPTFCRKLDWLQALHLDLSRDAGYRVPVLGPGDLFHRWNSPPEVITAAIERLPGPLILVPGQHDLPQHSLPLLIKSALRTFLVARPDAHLLIGGDAAQVGEGGCGMATRVIGWGWDAGDAWPPPIPPMKDAFTIILTHRLIRNPGDGLPRDAGGTDAARTLAAAPGADAVVSGDNHARFLAQRCGRWLINAGGFVRCSTAQLSHRPAVAILWRTAEGGLDVEWREVPIEDGVISVDHVERAAAHEERVRAFAEALAAPVDGGEATELDFERLAQLMMRRSGLTDEARAVVRSALEETR